MVKKITSIALSLAMLLSFSACGSNSNVNPPATLPTPMTTPAPSNGEDSNMEEFPTISDIVDTGDDLNSMNDVNIMASASHPDTDYSYNEVNVKAGTYEAVHNFSYGIAEQIIQSEDESTIFSPFSIYMALAMLAPGANNETKDHLLDVLGMPSTEELASQMNYLYTYNYSEYDEEKYNLLDLQIGNSLWLNKNYANDIKSGYVDTVANNFYADVFNIDFTNAGQLVPAWIVEKTHGLLHPSLDINPDAVLALVNTVYYKSSWHEEFYDKSNTDEEFKFEDGTTYSDKITYMNRFDKDSYALETDEYIKASLSLNDSSITFILPKGDTKVKDLATAEKLKEIMSANTINADVSWKVPKIETDTTLDLKETITNIGLGELFGQPDLSNISDNHILVSAIQHGAHIGVDEEGIEAAAYTVITAEGASVDIDEPELPTINVHLDRPFIYIIESNTHMENSNVPLFIGTYFGPNA